MKIFSCFRRFLDYISSHFFFIGLSLIFRVIEALGASAAVVAAFAMIGSYFPDHLSTVFVSTIHDGVICTSLLA